MGAFDLESREQEKEQQNELSLIINEITALEKQLKEYKKIENKCKDYKEKLKDAMEKYGVKEWYMPNGTKATLVEAKPEEVTQVEYFDEITFKKEHPDLYNQYIATHREIISGRKGYARITIPKEIEDGD